MDDGAIVAYVFQDAGEYWATTSPNPCKQGRLFVPWMGDPAGPWIEKERGGGYIFGQLYDYAVFDGVLIPR